MNVNTAKSQLFHILDEPRVRLDSAYRVARADGLEEPILLVLDLLGEDARALARRIPVDIPVEEIVAGATSRGRRPSLVVALDLVTAIEAIAGMYPALLPLLASPRLPGVYLAVGLSGGVLKVAEFPRPDVEGRPGADGFASMA